jgi:hypothetical protein
MVNKRKIIEGHEKLQKLARAIIKVDKKIIDHLAKY